MQDYETYDVFDQLPFGIIFDNQVLIHDRHKAFVFQYVKLEQNNILIKYKALSIMDAYHCKISANTEDRMDRNCFANGLYQFAFC